MRDFLVFSVRRYSRFCSYLAVFLAGLGFSLSGVYFWIPFILAILLGSLSAYERKCVSARSDAQRRIDRFE